MSVEEKKMNKIRNDIDDKREYFIKLYHDMKDDKDYKTFIDVWTTVRDMINAERNNYNVSIVLSHNQELLYQIVEFWIREKLISLK